MHSVSAATPLAGIAITYAMKVITTNGGSMVFLMINSVEAGDVVRESYQLPFTVELVWTQQTCTPPPPVVSSKSLLASTLKAKPWEQVKSVEGVVGTFYQE